MDADWMGYMCTVHHLRYINWLFTYIPGVESLWVIVVPGWTDASAGTPWDWLTLTEQSRYWCMVQYSG